MNLDELREAWKSQEGDPRSGFDASEILQKVREKQRKFNRSIFWRDVREVGAALLVAAVFFFYGTLSWPGGRLWTWNLAAAMMIGVGAFMVIDRIRQRRWGADLSDLAVDTGVDGGVFFNY